MQELVDEPQLVHDAQGGRMHSVAAEVAQEVIVLLQDNNPDPGAGKQQGVNQAGGTATGNADLRLQNSRHGLTLLTNGELTGTVERPARNRQRLSSTMYLNWCLRGTSLLNL